MITSVSCCFSSLPLQPVQQDGFPGLAAPAVAKAAGGVRAGRLELLLSGHKHRGGHAGVPGRCAAADRHAGACPQVVVGAGAAGVSGGASRKIFLLCDAAQFCSVIPKLLRPAGPPPWCFSLMMISASFWLLSGLDLFQLWGVTS